LGPQGILIRQLGATFSEHIMRLVASPIVVAPEDEGPSEEWIGVVTCLLMEYCSQSMLEDLFERRVIQ
jgi:hypothetical protein